MKTFAAAAFAALVLVSGTGAQAEDAGKKIVVKNRQMIVAITSGKLEDEIVGRPAIIQKSNLAYIIGMTRSVHRACGVLSATDSAALDRLDQAYRAEKVKDELAAAMQVMVVSELDNGASDTAALLTRYDCQALQRFNLTGPLLAFWNKYLAVLKG
ncbi:hypothetical protein V5F44_04895 [Xanthobacter sp. V2C-8]|uniref:hypothetical protein n=1 Tax=Xanthobacteraceae TaxID=335928 RepID=UPI00237ED926|nr:hypothetical protein [Aquabacter sp. P-9]MDE1567084.1 hypothetical protein [Aquabacter sp. P-9]